MLVQREVALACLSQDRLGRGVDAHTAAATLDKGFPSGSVLGCIPRWAHEEVGVGKQVCSVLMWAQLRPAEHETGVLPGVLPRLRVAFVFPTQALGHEGLALRCNGNKSPNHWISSRS